MEQPNVVHRSNTIGLEAATESVPPSVHRQGCSYSSLKNT